MLRHHPGRSAAWKVDGIDLRLDLALSFGVPFVGLVLFMLADLPAPWGGAFLALACIVLLAGGAAMLALRARRARGAGRRG